MRQPRTMDPVESFEAADREKMGSTVFKNRSTFNYFAHKVDIAYVKVKVINQETRVVYLYNRDWKDLRRI